MARAASSTTTSERTKVARGLFRSDEQEMQRPLDGRAGGDADHRAVAHQSGVERHRNIVTGASLPRCAVSVGSPSDSAMASEPTVRPASSALRSDSSATNAPSTKTRRRVSTSPRIAPAIFARALAAASGGLGERLGVAHQRAQIGIFPLFDAAMRQAFLGEHVEGRVALRGNRFVAGQTRARLREGVRQRGLRRGLDDASTSGVHAKTSS